MADLFAPRCWHLALFLVATPLRGTGVAHRVLRDLESWIESQGAGWIRLGVGVRNTRGERFNACGMGIAQKGVEEYIGVPEACQMFRMRNVGGKNEAFRSNSGATRRVQ